MHSCTLYLVSRLIWSNLKVIFYVSIWLFLLSLVAFKVFNADELFSLNTREYISKNTLTYILQNTGIFILAVISTNSLYLILLDIQNYVKYRHRLDDPKIRTNLLIEAINTSQRRFYFMEELRPGYFRLAYRIRSSSKGSHTVIDGSISVIKNYLTQFVFKISTRDIKASSLCAYNKKCLELCNIKYFNLVKRQLYT
jgi:hypothetical protein